VGLSFKARQRHLAGGCKRPEERICAANSFLLLARYQTGTTHQQFVRLIRNIGIRRVDAERGRQRDEMILLVDQDAAQAFGDCIFV
jgi:hypothetical protein